MKYEVKMKASKFKKLFAGLNKFIDDCGSVSNKELALDKLEFLLRRDDAGKVVLDVSASDGRRFATARFTNGALDGEWNDALSRRVLKVSGKAVLDAVGDAKGVCLSLESEDPNLQSSASVNGRSLPCEASTASVLKLLEGDGKNRGFSLPDSPLGSTFRIDAKAFVKRQKARVKWINDNNPYYDARGKKQKLSFGLIFEERDGAELWAQPCEMTARALYDGVYLGRLPGVKESNAVVVARGAATAADMFDLDYAVGAVEFVGVSGAATYARLGRDQQTDAAALFGSVDDEVERRVVVMPIAHNDGKRPKILTTEEEGAIKRRAKEKVEKERKREDEQKNAQRKEQEKSLEFDSLVRAAAVVLDDVGLGAKERADKIVAIADEVAKKHKKARLIEFIKRFGFPAPTSCTIAVLKERLRENVRRRAPNPTSRLFVKGISGTWVPNGDLRKAARLWLEYEIAAFEAGAAERELVHGATELRARFEEKAKSAKEELRKLVGAEILEGKLAGACSQVAFGRAVEYWLLQAFGFMTEKR